jgi:elongation factor G
MKVAITFGSYHEVDSSEMAFKICGSMALKDAAKKSKPVLLEPIMKVVVTTPDQFMGDVIGDINRRRGKILNQTTEKGTVNVESEVPLSEMFGYSTQLRSLSSGRANYTMEPSHFEKVPTKLQEEILTAKQTEDSTEYTNDRCWRSSRRYNISWLVDEVISLITSTLYKLTYLK